MICQQSAIPYVTVRALASPDAGVLFGCGQEVSSLVGWCGGIMGFDDWLVIGIIVGAVVFGFSVGRHR